MNAVPALLSALVFSLPVAAVAADKPASPKPGAERAFGTNAKGPLLTRDELRSCFAQQDQLRAENEDIGRQRAVREAERDALVKSGEALKADLAALDRTSAEAVEQYNAKAAARDKAIDEHQTGATAFNQRIEAFNARKIGFDKACGNRRYDEADEAAIRKGR